MKKAAAVVNKEFGLDSKISDAISAAADEVNACIFYTLESNDRKVTIITYEPPPIRYSNP